MTLSPSNKSGKGRGRKSRAREFTPPQIMLPSHLSGWPDVKIPEPPNSAPKSQAGKKLFASAKGGITFDRDHKAQEKEDQFQSRKKGISRNSDQVKLPRQGGNEEGRHNVDTSSEGSSYSSALEDPSAMEGKRSNLIRKINDLDDASTGNEVDTTDGTSNNTNNEESDAKMNSSPLTLEEGSSERKERLKDATASQKQDKSTGKKKNKEKGGLENVFNARSPMQEHFNNLMREKSITPTQTQNRAKVNNSPAFGLPGSSTKDVSTVRNGYSNATPRKSSAKLLVEPNKNFSPRSMPFRSPSIAAARNAQKTSPSTEAHQTGQEECAAVTEAQLQANLLRRSGHREFSSQAFEMSREDEEEHKSNKGPAEGKKKNKKKAKVEEVQLDPVEMEIAKQRASYNNYMIKRMKKNPDHYSNGGTNTFHELTSEEDSDRKKIHEGRGSANSDIDDNGTLGEKQRGSGYEVNTPRSGTHDGGDQTWSATKKDKDRRKRKRDQEDRSMEEDADIEGSRKKSRNAGSEKYRRSGTEGQNHSFGDTCSNDGSIVREIAKGASGTHSTQSTATYIQNQQPVSVQQLRNAPHMTIIPENASANADFMATLKSFWGIIPKAILHATMVNLNKTNRRSLNAKLKSCQKGKQTNPRIRIVTRINENGDEIDLLEEYGKISEPDPHTMSSELTLLTAAKDLIVLLSGQRVGLDLSSIFSPSLEGEVKVGDTSHRGQPTQGHVGVISPLEEQLSRIAGEYQKEIDKLREENRDLAAKVKKSKR